MAYQTFGEIKTFAMNMLSEEEQDQVFQQGLLSRWGTRVRDRINQWHSWMWKEGLIRLTWPGIATGGPGTAAVLYLPEDVDQILSMYPNNLSYREPVRILQRWEFDQLRPGNTIGRGIDYLVIFGYYSVKRDNPSTTQIDVEASGAGNAENLQCRIVGRDQDNDAASEVVTLDALGQATTTKTFLGGPGLDGVTRCEIVKESLSGLTDPGIVSFQSAGTELESLNADQGEVKKERRRTELYAQIGGPGTYQIAYYRRYKPLTSDSDPFLPEIPNEFADISEYGIMAQVATFRKEWESKRMYEAEFLVRMRELQAWANREPGMKRRLQVNRQWGTRTNRR